MSADEKRNDSAISKISVDDFSAFSDRKSISDSKNRQSSSEIGALKFEAGESIEALMNGQWKKAHILEVDDSENEVLIGFGDNNNKQEWIPMSSSSIREIDFRPGDKCVLIKSDSFVTLRKRLGNGKYEIEYDYNGAKEIVNKDDLKVNELSLMVTIPFSKLPESLVNSKFKKPDEPINKFEFYDSIKPNKVRLAHDPSKSEHRRLNQNEECDHDSGSIKWKNGVPVGEQMTIKVNNKDFLSYLVEDKLLPANWSKYVIRKKKRSQNDSQWKVIIISPDGIQFHNSRELRTYLSRYPSLNYKIKDFEFSLFPKKPPLHSDRRSDTIAIKPSPSFATPKNSNYDVFQCPHQTCNKQFRKLSLMQMHVKHYHPELRSYYASTPNVADLAYARTITSSKDAKDDVTEAAVKPRSSCRTTPQPIKMPFPPDEIKAEIFEQKPDSVIIQNVPGREDVIIVDGQIRKIVQMKPEEVINCFCNVTEEDGLMIQCELCCCWQHAYCNGFEKEEQIPDKYICLICINSFRMRESMRYFHDQDWMKDGAIPVFQDKQRNINLENVQELLRKSHDLYGNMKDLKEYLYSINVKIHILRNKNHPKLYLWSKKWPEPDSVSKLLMSGADFGSKIEHNIMEPVPEVKIDTNICRLNLVEHIKDAHLKANARLAKLETEVEDLLDQFEKCTNVKKSYLESDENLQLSIEMLSQLVNDLDVIKKLSTLILNKETPVATQSSV